MLMGIGQFVFSITTLDFQELQRRTSWRFATQDVVGARPTRQFLGPGDDVITLSGVVAIELTGGTAAIDRLREMGDTGSKWPLVSGSGYVLGEWTIEGLDTTSTYLLPDGTPRRVEFQLELHRADDKRAASVTSSAQ